MKLRLTVNGSRREVEVDEGTPLLWVLRDDLGLPGTKYGCGMAQCGACTVHLGGRPVRSCVLPVGAVRDREITTIEGMDDPLATAVKDSWRTLQVPQCGYCQSGQIMTAIALLREIPRPDERQIDDALAGNVCRCAAYQRIRQAVQEAARRIGGGDRG